jgi:hypothetical protein
MKLKVISALFLSLIISQNTQAAPEATTTSGTGIISAGAKPATSSGSRSTVSLYAKLSEVNNYTPEQWAGFTSEELDNLETEISRITPKS